MADNNAEAFLNQAVTKAPEADSAEAFLASTTTDSAEDFLNQATGSAEDFLNQATAQEPGILQKLITPIPMMVDLKNKAKQAIGGVMDAARPDVLDPPETSSPVTQAIGAVRSSLIPLPSQKMVEGSIELGLSETPLDLGLGLLGVGALVKAMAGPAKVAAEVAEVAPKTLRGATVGERILEASERLEGAAKGAPQPTSVFVPTPRSPVPDRAININLSKLNTTDDVKSFIADVAEANKGSIDEARRGTITFSEQTKLANDLGMTRKEMLKRQRGAPPSAETAIAYRQTLVRSAEEAVAKAQAVVSGSGSMDDAVEFLATHLRLTEQAAGAAAESGRALGSYRIAVGGGKEASIRAVSNALGGKEITKDIVEKLAKLDPLDTRSVNKFIRGVSEGKFSDKVFEAWVNALISGPQTHIVNAASNTITSMIRPLLERPVTAAVEVGRAALTGTKRERFLGEAAADVYGMASAFGDGASKAFRAFVDEIPELSKVNESSYRQAIPGLAGKVIRTPGRLLVASDEFFKTINRAGEAHALAYRKAAKAGVSLSEMPEYIAAQLNKMSPQDLLAIEKEGLYRTFQAEMGPVGQWVSQGRKMVPGLRFIIPFVRTPVNVAKFGLKLTPLGILDTGYKVAFKGLKGGELSADLAKSAIGMMATWPIASKVMDGTITGGGPSDKEQKKILMDSGWQPYSIRVGNEYFSYARFEPLAITMGLIADGAELMSIVDKEDMVAKASFALATNVTNKTFMKGFARFLDALQNPDRYGKSFFQQFAGSLIPSVVAQAARAQDPIVREPRTIGQAVQARIPGQSENVPALRDVWGQPIVRYSKTMTGIERFLSPVYVSQLKNDPATSEIVRLKMDISSPRRSVADVDLTEDDYSTYAEMAGNMAKQRVDALVAGPGWVKVPDPIKEKLIGDAFTDGRRISRSILFSRLKAGSKVDKAKRMVQP